MVTYIFYGTAGVFLFCFLVQLFFILFRHGKLRSFTSYIVDEEREILPVSVVICARNEQENLKANLPLVLEQHYPNFEVVVVNDCSNDDSEYVLRELSTRYSSLRVVTLTDNARFRHGKKFAVTMGIKAARHEHLLFTDADCRPDSPLWIEHMQRHFSSTTSIVLGYSPYEKLGGLLNALIRFETLFTAINYLSFALAGKPYMGVGRNMAYKKSLFFSKKGFASHIHIPSGDDDLFVNEHASRENTLIEISEESQMWSTPKQSMRAYWKQKRRHMGAGRLYKSSDKATLSLQTGSAFLFITLIPVLIFALKAIWWQVMAFYAFRMLVAYIVYVPVFRKLRCADLLWGFPFLDLIYNVLLTLVGSVSAFKKPARWH